MTEARPRSHGLFLVGVFVLAVAVRFAVGWYSGYETMGPAISAVIGHTVLSGDAARVLARATDSLLSAGVVLLLYAWLHRVQPRSVTRLACLVAAVHPTLVAMPFQTYTAGFTVPMLVLLAGVAGVEGTRGRLKLVAAVFLGVGLAIMFGQSLLMGRFFGAVADPPLSPWAFWQLAPAGASLRAVLAAYCGDGAIVGLAAVGLAQMLRSDRLRCVAPGLVLVLTWIFSIVAPVHAPALRGIVLPILIAFASIGMWRIYVGMGRFGGHGILAVDPVRKRRPHGTAADA